MFRKLLFIGLFLPFYLNAQTAGQVAISIGEPGNDAGNCIINTSTGGYAIAGYTSCGACPSDLYIVRLDSIGTLEWTKAVGGSNDDYSQSLVQTKDGGFAVTGSTTSYGAGGGGIYLVKVN